MNKNKFLRACKNFTYGKPYINKHDGELQKAKVKDEIKMNEAGTRYYKITLNKVELLITQHCDFAKYMFKFIRELTEYKADMQLIVGIGFKFENSFIMFDYSTKHNKNT